MPTIKTGEGRIYITDHRKSDSSHVPVILVHGAGGTHLDWPAALRKLPQANAIAIDLPGHGKSEAPGRETIDDYTRAVIALMDALEIPQAVIAGHSMGGAIAQTLALDYADRAAGIILLGTGARLRVHPDIVERVLTDQQAVAELLRDWIWAESAPQTMRDLAYEQLMNTPAQVIHNDYKACNHFDVMPRLNEIAMPALVIGGTEDRMTPHKYSQFLHDNIANSHLVTVEGGGHMMALEQTDFVVAEIASWLDALHEVSG